VLFHGIVWSVISCHQLVWVRKSTQLAI